MKNFTKIDFYKMSHRSDLAQIASTEALEAVDYKTKARSALGVVGLV